jgi:hypothetical protein
MPAFSHSPFNPIQRQDKAEKAGNDEQGGSSERGNSYLGDGFINISTELLNSIDDQPLNC